MHKPVSIALLVTIAAFAGPSDARQKVWAISFAQLVKEPPGWSQVQHHETRSVAFSPDDRHLAVTLAHGGFNTHLFIVKVSSPETNVRQFDLSQTCGADLTWNEPGNAILVCGTILTMTDGNACAVVAPPPQFPSVSRAVGPHQAFWLDPDHVIRRTGEILDLTCKQVGLWQVEPPWQLTAVAASKRWALLQRHEGPQSSGFCQYSIVDSGNHKPSNGWPGRKAPLPCSSGTMAVGAQAMCATILGGILYVDKPKLHCWAVNGGAEIPIPGKLQHDKLMEVSSSSARVLVEKWDEYHYPWWESLLTWWVPVPGFPSLPQQRAIFDLRSRIVISSWKPGIQQGTSPFIEDWPYHCALSADGDYIAESGDGDLNLYRIPTH